MEESQTIKFYRVGDPFGEFSNFAAFPIFLDGEQWLTSEHYFQAQKFEDPAYRNLIRLAESPGKAAQMGRDRSKPLRKDWEAVKDDVMRTAVREKFSSHEKLKQLLLSTGDAWLIEHTTNDSYWGDGGDGTGKNMLGRILMEIRDELRGMSSVK